MTEQQARENVRPLAPSVHVLPSESQRPSPTDAQRLTLQQLGRTHDEVGELRVNPDGTVLVTVADYGESGERWEADLTIYTDGVPF